MRRALVTGGTGFVGHAVVRLLLERGFAVRVLTRGSWPFQHHPRLERANGSMTNARAIREAVKGCDVVIHLAARKNDEADSEAVNVEGTRVLCGAAKKENVERVVYASTQSAVLKRRGVYGETKLRGEEAVKTSGTPYVILRPSLVYGDGDAGVFATVEKLSKLPFVPVFGDGSATFRPLHVEDAAAMIVAAAEEPEALGKTLDAGGPDEVTFDGLIRRVQHAKGISRPILHLPVWLGLLGARVLGVLPRPPVTRSNVLGGIEALAMDVATADAVLNVFPRPFALGADAPDRDASALLSYVSGGTVTPTPELAARFRAACRAHGIGLRPTPSRFVLPYVDAASRLWAPRSGFRSALLVAAAVAECTPDGADAFLPRDASLPSTVFRVALLGPGSAWYAVIGSLLWMLPSVRRRAS